MGGLGGVGGLLSQLPPAFWCLSALGMLACGPAYGFIVLSFVVTAAVIPSLCALRSEPRGRRRRIDFGAGYHGDQTLVLLAMGPAVFAALWGLRWLDHTLDDADRTLHCHGRVGV